MADMKSSRSLGDLSDDNSIENSNASTRPNTQWWIEWVPSRNPISMKRPTFAVFSQFPLGRPNMCDNRATLFVLAQVLYLRTPHT
jgi:hypothetical protein